MAKHDILLWNTTSSIFETNLSSNTARIKGDSSALLSIESGSTELFKVDTTNSSVIFETHITASGNISGSATSTASFGGNVIVDRLSGDASLMTGADVYQEGHISSSNQLATEISGAFDSGFRMSSGSLLSGSSTSTGSFSYIYASDFDVTHAGELIDLINVSESLGTLSGSAQIASAISGAFDRGFRYTGEISGSSTSTGSFGDLFTNDYPSDADVSEVVNTAESYPTNTLSSSAQIAADVSGSFTKGFVFSGSAAQISGSSTSTASVDYFFASDYSGVSSFDGFTNYIPAGTVSGSAQLASAISGAFDGGFKYTGQISGSIASTGSFHVVFANNYTGDASALTNTPEDGHFSGSAQMAADISGSFISGFRVSGSAGAGQPLISGSSASTASLDYIFSDYYSGDVTDITNVYDGTNALSSSAQIADDVSGSFISGFRIGSGSGVSDQAGYIGAEGLMHRNQASPNLSLLSSNAGGYWTQGSDMLTARYGGGSGGTQTAGIYAGGRGDFQATEWWCCW